MGQVSRGDKTSMFEPGTKYSEAMGRCLCIFQTEVHTIDICARVDVDREYNRENIAIMSDSQTVVQALSSPVIRSRMIWECQKRLNLLGRSNNVTVTGCLSTLVWTGLNLNVPSEIYSSWKN